MSVYSRTTATTRVLKTQPQTASKKQNGTATTPATALKYKAWYLAKFLCRDVDDPDNYERLREHVSRCRGIKTRVRLSKDGWSAGRRRHLLTTKHRGENVKLDCIEDLMQDEKFINVLLCIFELDLPDGIRFEIVAYKFRSPDEVRSLVELYGLLTGRVETDLPRSVVNGGGGGSVIVRQPVVGVAPSVRQNGTARPGSVTSAMTMPGRPTNGQLAPNHWSTGGRPVAVDGQRGFSQRRYMSASVGDLTADGYYGRGIVVRDQNGRVSTSTEGGRRLNESFDRRAWASENGSIIFTDSDTDTSPNVISSSQVNGTGRSYRTSNGGSSGIDDTDSGPIRLVYSRPPSDREIIVHQPNYATAPRDRYRSTDTLSFTQVPIRRARSVEPNSRYASSAFGAPARSDIYGRSSGIVHPASVVYQPPSLVHPRFKKQYVSKQLTAPSMNGGPVYRAASRSAHGSVYGGRNNGYYER